MLKSADIRKTFLDFFRSKGHQIVPSAPIVVKNDPSLLFTNAGMNQFKDYFLGNKKPEFTRVADTQKCLRVSGKHNDLEEVGVDTYHHTMFEMLGNWSFGDYFKPEAIAWSWELLTKTFGIDPDRLYVTVFQGDSPDSLPRDEEAEKEWQKHVPVERILYGGKKDNFWEMGETGPCGPCTEIHMDCRDAEERKLVNGADLVNKDHPQVIEIWNNVFIQFNRLKDGSLQPLPEKHVDTGMGFERLVRVLQHKQSNYDTDVFTPLITATESIVGIKYDYSDSKQAIAFRVISDHIRAISFTIADGQLPANTGAGYVIRRILRRAVRYYYSYLNYHEPLLHRIVPVLAKQFDNVFPELINQQAFIERVIKEEEEGFLRTLEKGLKKINDIIQHTVGSGSKTISGSAAFELFDTYGFPVDLTKLIASEQSISVDEPAFELEMQQQKNRSRAATALETSDWVEVHPQGMTEFVGYDSSEVTTNVVKYRKVKSKGKEAWQIVLSATPFYAESGGQVGDTGTLYFDREPVQVLDTKKENDLIVQITDMLPKHPEVPVVAKIDLEKRRQTAVHHTATHLLHAALKEVLGSHVNQKGSLVNEENLRFDFSHFAKVSDTELRQIESIVNHRIRENMAVEIRQMKKDDAINMGAMALFGEKYGERVRVVMIDPHFSIELCGGTHVSRTGDLGLFKIRQETAVAAGVRRIVAVSGMAAENYMYSVFDQQQAIAELIKHPKNPVQSIQNLLDENNDLRKRIEGFQTKEITGLKKELTGKIQTLSTINFIGEIVSVEQPDALKKLALELSKPYENHFVLLASDIKGKASVAIGISDSLVKQKAFDASKIIRERIGPLIKGSGGGQKTLAIAGGQDTCHFEEVIKDVRELISASV